MPLARDKPYLYVEGEGKVDVHGAARVIPEFNQEELLQGVKRVGSPGAGGCLGKLMVGHAWKVSWCVTSLCTAWAAGGATAQ